MLKIGSKSFQYNVEDVLYDFFEISIHTLLYIRDVYPPEIFEKVDKYGIPVRKSKHKVLNNYISNCLQGVKRWIKRNR
eukprot:UN26973